MSTIKVSNIKNAATTAGGLSIAADGVVSGALPSPNRNLLYNGAMQVSQRGTSSTGITSDGYYTADRWNVILATLGTWTQTIENDAPTGSGFRKSLKILCTTADSTPAAGDSLSFRQRLEGQDVQRIKKGASSAEPLTLSFWVKSNVTGTYVATLFDSDNSRQVGAQYTISASATWEKKSITFPADTTGAFDNDNDVSLQVIWWLGAGTDRTSGTLRTTWTTNTTADLAAGQTNLAAATNNYWQITGVQLEVGDTATPFEFKSFAQELRECLRYYEKSFKVDTAPANGQSQYGNAVGAQITATATVFIWNKFLVEKRSTPIITLFNPRPGGTAGRMTNSAADDTGTTFATNIAEKGFMIQSGASLGANNWYVHYAASSEL